MKKTLKAFVVAVLSLTMSGCAMLERRRNEKEKEYGAELTAAMLLGAASGQRKCQDEKFKKLTDLVEDLRSDLNVIRTEMIKTRALLEDGQKPGPKPKVAFGKGKLKEGGIR